MVTAPPLRSVRDKGLAADENLYAAFNILKVFAVGLVVATKSISLDKTPPIGIPAYLGIASGSASSIVIVTVAGRDIESIVLRVLSPRV